MSTYLSLHYHLVFSTKNRQTFIKDGWAAQLHEYLGGTVNGLGGFSQGVGGISDHVHLLVGLKATHCLADFMRELKKASSIWVHEELKATRIRLAGRILGVYCKRYSALGGKTIHCKSERTSSA